jgi:hypothetical protein
LDFGSFPTTGSTTIQSDPVVLPVTLAMVSHAGMLYAGYKSGSTWTRLQGSFALPTGVNVGLSEEGGSTLESSGWRDFNKNQVALSDLGIP